MSAANAPTRLLVVRHGQIDANTTGIWHGSTDSPLNDLGRTQAQRVADYLGEEFSHCKAIYTSPLERTRHTAEAIGKALSLEPIHDAGFAEWGIGELEGTHYQVLLDELKFFHKVSDRDFAPPGGESRGQVIDRFVASMTRVAREHDGLAVVVTHGAASALGLAQLLGDPDSWRERHASNCSVTEIEFTDPPRILRFNYTEHLE